MEIHLYKTNQVCKFLSKASIVIVFVLFGLKAQSQGVISNLTYGNQIQQQLPVFPCEGNILLSAAYTSQITSDTLILFYPNTFQIDSIFPETVITNFANGFISLRIPLNSLVDTLDFSFSYTNCLASEYTIDSNINSSNLIFQCYLQSLPNFASYNYNGVPLIPSPNIPAFVTFTSATVPPIEFLPGLNVDSAGIANDEYFRYFDVVVNTTQTYRTRFVYGN